jgi:hypothetical protein
VTRALTPSVLLQPDARYAPPGDRPYYRDRVQHYPSASPRARAAPVDPDADYDRRGAYAPPGYPSPSAAASTSTSASPPASASAYPPHVPDPRLRAPSPESSHVQRMREVLALSADMPTTLADLQDPPERERPQYPLPLLTALAIHSSERKMLTLQEIYAAIQRRFKWYEDHREDKKGWKGSIRHNLSLNKIFRQVPRPITEPGQGKYWELDFSQGPGNKRVRIRGSAKGRGKDKDKAGSSAKGKKAQQPPAQDLTEEEEIADRASMSVSPPPPVASGSGSAYDEDDYDGDMNMQIDPALRHPHGHVVGARHPRPSARASPRPGPYPAPAPALRLPPNATYAYAQQQQQQPQQQGVRMSSGSPTAPPFGFGQPSFGQPHPPPGAPFGQPHPPAFGAPAAFGGFGSGGAHPNPSLASNAPAPAPNAFLAAAAQPVGLAPQHAHGQRQQQLGGARADVEIVRDGPGGLPVKRRVQRAGPSQTQTQAQGPGQRHSPHGSGSGSGSSRSTPTGGA